MKNNNLKGSLDLNHNNKHEVCCDLNQGRIDKFKPINGDMTIFDNIECVMSYKFDDCVLFLQNATDLPYDGLPKSLISIEEVTQDDVDLIRSLYFGVKEHGNT